MPTQQEHHFSIIDISPLLQSDCPLDHRRKVAEQIDRSCREQGFFYISGHGIPDDLRTEVLTMGKQFFSLDAADKRLLEKSLTRNHRGYFGLMDENVADSYDINQVVGDNTEMVKMEDSTDAGSSNSSKTTIVVDLKEGFEIGRDNPSGKEDEFQGPNVWFSEHTAERLLKDHGFDASRWRTAMESYYEHVLRVGQALLTGFALALNLDEHFFDHMFTEPIAMLRMLHYFPPGEYESLSRTILKKSDTAQHVQLIGCGEHTDYGFVTILNQDSVGGLQAKVNGVWKDVTPIKDTLVINLGDALQIWTNGVYRATPHRVVLNSAEQIASHRYSMAFFYEPNYHTIISCLPTCRDDDQGEEDGRSFPQFKYGEYLKSRLDATYSYRKPTDEQ